MNPTLRPWKALPAANSWNQERILRHLATEEKGRRPVPSQGALLFDLLPLSDKRQALKRALKIASRPKPELFLPDPSLESEPWHQALPRATQLEVRVQAQAGGAHVPLDDFEDLSQVPSRPFGIQVAIFVKRPATLREEEILLSTDLALGGSEEEELDPSHSGILVQKDSRLRPKRLARILKEAYFRPEADRREDWNAFEEERTWFLDQARLAAEGVLRPGRKGSLKAIRRIVRREIQWMAPPGDEVHVTLRKRRP